MTPETLLERLSDLPADLPLVFETPAGRIAGGYHVTELKAARVASVDCAARTSEWTDAVMQLLDGRGGAHMTAGKFRAILSHGVAHLPDFATSEIGVEFAHRNVGMRLHEVSAPRLRDGEIAIALTERSALCRPAYDWRLAAKAATARLACCG